ncbi:M20/M25/M40 family metallo-hydrolase [Anaerolentibacter hominis]|uniref:M20/M25/M40 family metallo-hydrolase n=1 Tax=Anaerolentibacter hominis TaxID=3079009 RepID=UPI0031B85399
MVDKNIVLKYIEEYESELESLLIEIANIESPSSDLDGCRRVALVLKQYCESIGMSARLVEFEGAAPALIAQIGDKTKPGIGFMGHMDTVHPVGSFGSPAVTCDAEKLYGPGVYDCKGGLVMALLVIQSLLASGYKERPFKLIFLGDEEISHHNAGGACEELIMNESLGLAAMFNMESGRNGYLTVGRKGGIDFDFIIQGIAAHAGHCPEKGASAIREAACKILEIEKNTDLNDLTYNCGLINGGSATNVVPEECRFSVDARFRYPESREKAIKLMEQIAAATYVPGTRTTLINHGGFQAMPQTQATMKLFDLYNQCASELGYPAFQPEYSGGNADSAYSVLAGTPTLCSAGIEGGGVHTLQEYAVRSSLKSRAQILSLCVLSLQ